MNPSTDHTNRGGISRLRRNNAATGTAAASTLLLVYGLFRPDSLAFSIPFLIAPSLALLWTVQRTPTPNQRKAALVVTWGVGVAAIALMLIHGFSG